MTKDATGEPWEIRPARPDDLPATSKLAAELVRLHHRFDPLRFMTFANLEAGYERFLRTQIGRDDTVVLVAAAKTGEAETILGYTLGSLVDVDWSDLRDACGKIHDVFVDPTARGRGVASALVAETVRRLEAKGVPRVILMTAWPNEPARRLFERLGFRPTMIEMTREAGGAQP